MKKRYLLKQIEELETRMVVILARLDRLESQPKVVYVVSEPLPVVTPPLITYSHLRGGGSC